ncbi:hypothetical protein M3Y94_00676700 [Aphelenchoides besseyi]|nr:hypothetical protein M3Y94_00676700 [Aphelenchoides besseyi]KAI6231395.1 hypothetical protein M3Y95_00376900 [Aphelenchoides besseyi]
MSKALLLIIITFSFANPSVGVWCFCYMSGQCWTPGLYAWDTVQVWTNYPCAIGINRFTGDLFQQMYYPEHVPDHDGFTENHWWRFCSFDLCNRYQGTTVPPWQNGFNYSSTINEKMIQQLKTRTNISL